MSQIVFDKTHERYVRAFAKRVERRCYAAGGTRSASLDDIYQELLVAWCLARDGWEEQKGVPFLAYLQRGMISHINRWCARELGFINLAPISLDFENPDDEGSSFAEVIPSGDPLPDAIYEAKAARESILPKLSPTTRQFVVLFDDPPPELCEAVIESKARASYASERGLRSQSLRQVTAALVFDLMGLNRNQRLTVNNELREVAARVSSRSGA